MIRPRLALLDSSLLFDSYTHECPGCGLVRSISTERGALLRRADWVEEMFRLMGGGSFVPSPKEKGFLLDLCGACAEKAKAA